jgi:uncharacterized protein (DUF924 family)
MSLSDEVLAFWINAGPPKWFAKDPAFDEQIRDRFEALHMEGSRGALNGWAETPRGALALVILLDQFPRNMYRGSAHAFATDPLARAIARAALDAGDHLKVDADVRFFFFMPFEHSEEMADQDLAVSLFEALQAATGEPGNLKWAEMHRDIIARFTRFPHRNLCLGRESTAEEEKFLAEGGFSG